jgi:hypothetical protein
MRECEIACAAREGNKSSLLARDILKFDKHSSFCRGRQLPPNYYSLVVPAELVDTCTQAAPDYAGIYKAETSANTGWVSIKPMRMPALVSSTKADAIFFARCAEHLFWQLSDLHQAVAQIKITRSESRRKYLTDIARAVHEAETLIAQSGRADEATRRFLIERAVSGLSQRDKDHVARYYWSGEFLLQEQSLPAQKKS